MTAAPRLVNGARDRHVSGMKQLELTDAEVEALIQELSGTMNYARHPLAPRILSKLDPQPARPAASPEPRVYAPPSEGRYRRRGG